MTTTRDRANEPIDELMTEAEIMANGMLRQHGEVTPTLLIHGVDGYAKISPRDLSSEVAKDDFVEQARLLCVAKGADAAVFLSEAWMRTQKKGKALDLSIPPSQAPDRQEAVIIMGETRASHHQRIMPMMRSPDGKFAGFGEAPELEKVDRMEGRFANFVPPIEPDEQTRRLAKEAISMIGMIREEEQKKRQMVQSRMRL